MPAQYQAPDFGAQLQTKADVYGYTYGTRRHTYVEKFYEAAYEAAMEKYQDEVKAQKEATDKTRKEVMAIDNDIAELDKKLLSAASGKASAQYDKNTLLNVAARVENERGARMRANQSARVSNAQFGQKVYESPSDWRDVAGKLRDAGTNPAESEAILSDNRGRFDSYTETEKRVAGAEAVNAMVQGGKSQEDALRITAKRLGVPAQMIDPASVNQQKADQINAAGRYDIATSSQILNTITQRALADLEGADANAETKSAAQEIADIYIGGKRPATSFDASGTEITSFEDDDSYARMKAALADGTFGADDIASGLTEEDYQKFQDIGRIVEKMPERFSPSDRREFNAAMQELRKKRGAAEALATRTSSAAAPALPDQMAVRAEALKKAEPYQKAAPLEGLRLALGILPKDLRPVAKETGGTMQLTDEQKVMLGAARTAGKPDFKPGEAALDWARAQEAYRSWGKYQKGSAFSSAVEMSAGDNAKRDELLAALAWVHREGEKGKESTKESTKESATPPGVKNDASNFMQGAPDGGTSPRIEALLRGVLNPKVIPYPAAPTTMPSGAPVQPGGPSRIAPAPRDTPAGNPPSWNSRFDKLSQAGQLEMLPASRSNETPPIDTEDDNSDIHVAPTAQEVSEQHPDWTAEEIRAYLLNNYGVK